ncbi:hypothetical protein CHH55_16975 [Niallia circulans]|jgi:hypothetical protein|uniref:hypothetical protein n=1 Tax=Niallia circulans TaxID=1397 RepID=UPI000BA53FE7|nr:hypothetical protein [Niallia circulans]PAD86663.1 hypothetical protein CHH55_16975 [Niallia circulans]
MKLKIKTHSGGEFETEVEEYNPVEINDQINNSDILTILIGDKIFSRIDVKNVIPINQEN